MAMLGLRIMNSRRRPVAAIEPMAMRGIPGLSREGILPRRTTLHYMHPTQVRLNRELRQRIERLAREDRTTASEALRQALDEGTRVLLLRRAVEGYVEKRFSLGGAADHAGVSIAEMAA